MLSLILPTYNEAENIPTLLEGIADVLANAEYEVIIVDDDSVDETWRVGQQLAKNDSRVRVIRRVGRRGLSSAVIEGFLVAKGDVLAVMDADGQHDMTLLTKLYEAVQSNGGVAVGSRYTEGGSVGEWDERRYLMSRVATAMAIKLCTVKVSDPMSGFFALDRKTFEASLKRLNPKGFKILLDILVHAPKDTPVQEVPFTFAERMHGESKLSRRVQIEFLEYLYDVTFGRYLSLVFIEYCIVGALGVVVNFMAYTLLSLLLPTSSDIVPLALLGAIEISILFNFFFNNFWTFAQEQLKGLGMVVGLIKYNLACLVGALANFAVTDFLFDGGMVRTLSILIGAGIGAVWNYSMSRLFTWRRP